MLTKNEFGTEVCMKEVLRIELILENCEVVCIDREYIGVFEVCGIKEKIQRTSICSVTKTKTCQSFFLELFPASDKPYDGYDESMTVFQRLQIRNDIVSVGVRYEDNTKDVINLPWHGGGIGNALQTHILSGGHLYIGVGDKSVEHMVPSDTYTNPTWAAIRAETYT